MAEGENCTCVGENRHHNLVRCDLYFRGLRQAALRGGYSCRDTHVPGGRVVRVFQEEKIRKIDPAGLTNIGDYYYFFNTIGRIATDQYYGWTTNSDTIYFV